ncbi:conserved hypothetical protein [Xanthomonas citri pv. aurantifolii str. ICPB 11122]|nr:conserved hypothetical protein [Xanthomonas citri pv. aurantifolii str. ICPB 11122]
MGTRQLRCHVDSNSGLKTPRPSTLPASERKASRLTDWRVRGVAVIVVIACCGRLWLLRDAIPEGRHVSAIGGRPARSFLVDSDPHRFWITVGWDALLSCVPLALVGGFACASWKARRQLR